MSGALAGVRVVDMSRILAGPLCAMILGDHGADVVKLEGPDGDETRQWGPPFIGAQDRDAPPGYLGESAYYLFCNRNKKGISVDLSHHDGQEIALKLMETADVVVENFKPGTLERWGLSYEDVLRKRNPKLIIVSVSAFGATGPYAKLPGYDVLGQAMGGIMSVNGPSDAGPTRVGIALADISAGLYAVQGVLLALAARQRTHVGQRVECSLLDSVVSLLTHLASNYLIGGIAPQRYGNSHPSIVPYQLFDTSDGYVYIAVGNDRQFALLVEALSLPHLAGDPRFESNVVRVKNRQVLVSEMQEALAKRTTAHWVDHLRNFGVPVAAVDDIPQVFQNPQIVDRDMVISVPHPSTPSGIRMTGIPVKLIDTPGAVTRHPPLFGEHTREVLRDLGYRHDEIALLESRGIAYSWPRRNGAVGP
jgi:crotonobetainyl-CoA:carnitine CoA-transferase CaiB-like acyl-CoA transferase